MWVIYRVTSSSESSRNALCVKFLSRVDVINRNDDVTELCGAPELFNSRLSESSWKIFTNGALTRRLFRLIIFWPQHHFRLHGIILKFLTDYKVIVQQTMGVN